MNSSIPKEAGEQSRMVRGALFLDYVRIVKSARAMHSARLAASDRELVAERVVAERWYPMAAFERLGLVILDSFLGTVFTEESSRSESAESAAIRARAILTVSGEPIRMFGRQQIPRIAAQFPELVVARSPRETLMRFRVLLSSFFDFPALDVLSLNDTSADITIDYGMCPAAERAASWQTLGFFEALLAMAGAPHHHCELVQRSWEVPGRATKLRLAWVDARRPRPRETGPADVPPEELAPIALPQVGAGSQGAVAAVSAVLDGTESEPLELGVEHRKRT